MTRESWVDNLTDIQTFFNTQTITKELMTTPCPTYVFEESDLAIIRKSLKDFFPDKEGFIKKFHDLRIIGIKYSMLNILISSILSIQCRDYAIQLKQVIFMIFLQNSLILSL